MKWLLSWCLVALSLLAGSVLADGASKVQVLANYSNITTSMDDDPHQAGYAVTLYRRQDGLLFGDFTFAPGTTEGFGGKLNSLKFDGVALAFEAKISSAYDVHNNRPTRELFDFKGKVKGGVLIGTLTQWNGYDLRKPEFVKQIKMKRVKTAMPLSFEDHQEIFQKDPW